MNNLHILATIHRAGQIASEIFEECSGELTPRQAQVLWAIAAGSGKSQTDIVAETDIDRSTLADICRRLKNRNLITRRRTKEDQRAYSLALTDEGRAVLKRMEKALTSSKFDKAIHARIGGLNQLRIVEPVREAAE